MVKLLISLIQVILLLTCISKIVTAQDYQIIEFDNESIKTDPLPYGKKFKITGPSQGADSIVFRVIDKDRPLSGLDETSSWAKKADDKDDVKFEIAFNTPLTFKTTYQFNYTFFKILGQQFIDEFIHGIEELAKNDVTNNYRTMATKEYLNNQILDLEKKLKQKYKIVQFVDGDKALTISSELSKDDDWNRSINAIPKSEKRITEITSSNDTLQKISKKIEELDDDEIGINSWTDKINTLIDLGIDTMILVNNKQEVNRLWDSWRNISIRKKGIEISQSFITKLKSVYKAGVVTSSSDIAVTDIQAVLIGTSFGFGALRYSNKATDLFSYFAFKFYFFPVDKSLRNAYLSNSILSCKKMYAIVGMTIADLNFKNQKLEDTSLGIKPVLGIGHDFNRFISAEAGVVIYNQPSLSNAVESSKLKGSCFLGLSFDVDIINALSKREKFYK